MATNLSFGRLRSWRGTQNNAFEELCYQLREPATAGTRTVKPGNPDRGVDWYLVRGRDVLGRQCKFADGLTSSVLEQMRGSLKTALEELPGLVEMVFYVPFELPEATPLGRGGGRRKSARQKWDDAVKRWRLDLDGGERLQRVEIVVGSEILDRLTADEHRGRVWFWFDEELFGPEWCRRQLADVKRLVDERYRPDLNVPVPVGAALEGLARGEQFTEQLARRQRAVLTALAGLRLEEPGDSAAMTSLVAGVGAFMQTAAAWEWQRVPPDARLPFDVVSREIARLQPLFEPAWAELREAYDAYAEKDGRHSALASAASLSLTYLDRAVDALHEFDGALRSSAAQAAQSATVLLHGEAGQGKTHLLLDVAERLLDAGHPVAVLLGGHFPERLPWSAIAHEFGLEDRGYELLVGAMKAAAQASGKRFVLLLDAINEADKPRAWRQNLDTIRVRLGGDGLVAFGASCRDTYMSVVRTGAWEPEWTCIEHHGLAGREEQAADVYFTHYGIEAPRVPLLRPEFTNPLFLKLYCEGLQRLGLTVPPAGSDSTTAIFERHIEAVAKVIDDLLALDPDDQTVQRAVEAFGAALISADSDRLALQDAKRLITALLPDRTHHPDTLFAQLLANGLMTRDLVRRGKGGDRTEDIVRFTYNRFSDYVVAKGLLEQHLDPSDVGASFAPGTLLSKWLDGADGGVIDAMTSLLPERTGVELLDILPEEERERRDRRYQAMLLRSLVTRAPTAFTSRTKALMLEADQHFRDHRLFDVLCQLAPDPAHPLGGDLLHRNFIRSRMPRRDRIWGRLLYHAGEEYGALARLLRWAERGPYPNLDPAVLESCCVPLVWLLSTPNRWTRDRTTKALAAVLADHLSVATKLVARFGVVDDPYLLERLAVAVHGAVLRAPVLSADADALLDTAQKHLLGREPASSLLMRDSVRGIAERIGHRTAVEDREAAGARSPASRALAHPSSRWRLHERYPSVPWDKPGTGYEQLWSAIDGPMGDRFKHSIRPIVERFTRLPKGSKIPTVDEFRVRVRIDRPAVERFLTTLTSDQRTDWKRQMEDTGWEDGGPRFVGRLRLDDRQRALLDAAVDVTYPVQAREKSIGFDQDWIKRWIFQRAVGYGWTPQSFGSFDARWRWSREDRAIHERWAEKYVAIAVQELFARMVDHHQMRERWGTARSDYGGPWQLDLREVDPTLPPSLVELDEHEGERAASVLSPEPPDAWWIGHDPGWRPREPVPPDWGARTDDLPLLERLVRVTDSDGRRWVRITGRSHWDEPADETLPEPSFSLEGRDLWYHIDGYLVAKCDMPSLQQHLRARRPGGDRAVRVGENAYLYECPWAAAARSPYWAWDEELAGESVGINAVAAGGSYAWSGGSADASLPGTVHVLVPHSDLFVAGGLSHAAPATWQADGRVVLRHVESGGTFRDSHHGLLADEEWLAATLQAGDWALVFNVVGEKNLNSGDRREPVYSWLLFGAAIGWDGDRWDHGEWTVRPHPPGQIRGTELE